MLAVAREYQKLGKPITKSEFGGELHTWIVEEIHPTRFRSPGCAFGISEQTDALGVASFGRIGSPETKQGS